MGNPHSLMALHKGRRKSRRIIQWNLNCLCGVDGQSAQTATEILKIVDAGRLPGPSPRFSKGMGVPPNPTSTILGLKVRVIWGSTILRYLRKLHMGMGQKPMNVPNFGKKC